MMSFINHTRDGQHQPAATPSLLAACIAMALTPTAAFAASTTEDTVVVDGGFDNTQDLSASQDQDYSVKTTTTGTKLLLVPRDIPQSVSVISQQRMADQNLQSITGADEYHGHYGPGAGQRPYRVLLTRLFRQQLRL